MNQLWLTTVFLESWLQFGRTPGLITDRPDKSRNHLTQTCVTEKIKDLTKQHIAGVTVCHNYSKTSHPWGTQKNPEQQLKTRRPHWTQRLGQNGFQGEFSRARLTFDQKKTPLVVLEDLWDDAGQLTHNDINDIHIFESELKVGPTVLIIWFCSNNTPSRETGWVTFPSDVLGDKCYFRSVHPPTLFCLFELWGRASVWGSTLEGVSALCCSFFLFWAHGA